MRMQCNTSEDIINYLDAMISMRDDVLDCGYGSEDESRELSWEIGAIRNLKRYIIEYQENVPWTISKNELIDIFYGYSNRMNEYANSSRTNEIADMFTAARNISIEVMQNVLFFDTSEIEKEF